MNCFQLIKTVLDEVYEQIPVLNEAAKDNLIRREMASLREQYKHLKNGLQIDYNDPVTRFAYIFKYVSSHANMVYWLIKFSPNLQVVLDQPKVTMTCIGGGPGSDLLGVLKYLVNYEKNIDLRCLLYDREQSWGESWSDVDEKLDVPFRVSTVFQSFDVTDSRTWIQHNKYLVSDLFTMIFFASEVYSQRIEAESFFANLFSRAKQGAKFLYVDNNSPAFNVWFDTLRARHGLSSLEQAEEEIRMPLEEQIFDLGRYAEKFEESPKLKGQIAWRICRKD